MTITDVARNDLIMAKLLHPFWLELQEKPPLLAEKSWLQQLSRRGKFCMREWMCGMHGMCGLPRPMRGGWQVCACSEHYSLNQHVLEGAMYRVFMV